MPRWWMVSRDAATRRRRSGRQATRKCESRPVGGEKTVEDADEVVDREVRVGTVEHVHRMTGAVHRNFLVSC